MAQHDYNLANQSGADFRADLNNALSAIATTNSGATSPSTTFAHQLWVDTANNLLKIRNSANDAWITTGVSITADNTFTGNLTGNASTATALETARTINGALRFCMDKARSKRMSQNSWDKYNKMIAQYIAGIIEITWDENGNLKTSEVEYDPKPGN